MSDDLLVYKWTRTGGSRGQVRAMLTSWRGERRVDLRVWTFEAGEMLPTKRGLSLPLSELPGLRAAVDALIAAAESEEAMAA